MDNWHILSLCIALIALVLAAIAYHDANERDVIVRGDLEVKGHSRLRDNNVAPTLYRWGSLSGDESNPHYLVTRSSNSSGVLDLSPIYWNQPTGPTFASTRVSPYNHGETGIALDSSDTAAVDASNLILTNGARALKLPAGTWNIQGLVSMYTSSTDSKFQFSLHLGNKTTITRNIHFGYVDYVSMNGSYKKSGVEYFNALVDTGRMGVTVEDDAPYLYLTLMGSMSGNNTSYTIDIQHMDLQISRF